MKTAILSSDSENELKLLIELAEKLGIKVLELSEEELEDYGLGKAIREGRTDELIDTQKFLAYLRK
jgi:hypothetical protein